MKKLRLILAGLALAIAPLFVHAAALADGTENSLIDWFFRAQAYTAPTAHHVALYTVCPTDSSAGTEVSGGSYARVAVTSSLANWAGTQGAGTTTASSGTSGTTSNNNAITFAAPTANWGQINCWGSTSAPTGGSIYFYSPLTVPKTVNNGDAAPSFAPGAATFQIDN